MFKIFIRSSVANRLSRYLRSMSSSASHAVSIGKNRVAAELEFSSSIISAVMIREKYDKEGCVAVTDAEKFVSGR